MESGRFGRLERLVNHRIASEFSVYDRFIDPGEILVNDSSGAEVKVSDFGISHLAFGQTNVHPARAQVAAGISLVQIIVVGRPAE